MLGAWVQPSPAPSTAPSVKVDAAIKASGLPKAARRQQHLDMGRSSAAPSPAPVAEGGVVKMGRRDAWARFLAYEVWLAQAGMACTVLAVQQAYLWHAWPLLHGLQAQTCALCRPVHSAAQQAGLRIKLLAGAFFDMVWPAGLHADLPGEQGPHLRAGAVPGQRVQQAAQCLWLWRPAAEAC